MTKWPKKSKLTHLPWFLGKMDVCIVFYVQFWVGNDLVGAAAKFKVLFHIQQKSTCQSGFLGFTWLYDIWTYDYPYVHDLLWVDLFLELKFCAYVNSNCALLIKLKQFILDVLWNVNSWYFSTHTSIKLYSERDTAVFCKFTLLWFSKWIYRWIPTPQISHILVWQ